MLLQTPLQYLRNLEKKELHFLLFWIGVSFVLHIIASVFSIGFQYYDEHFQILEFAALKLGKTSEEFLPWEYPARIRPTIQPAFAYGYIKLFALEDPFTIAFVGRLISGILGWFSTFLFTLCAIQWINSYRLRKFLIVLTALLWFLPYIHVRFSSESWSGSLFFIGLSFLLISQTEKIKSSATSIRKEIIWLCAAGFLMGLAYVFRLQAGFLLPGVFLWGLLIAKIKLPKLIAMGVAVLAAIGLGVLFDKWFYGEWVNTAYHYFEENIIHDKASKFGVEPWWFYFTQFYKKAIAPFSLLMIIAIITTWVRFPKNVLTWAIIPFVLLHSLVGHKELRFLFPLANAVPVLIVLSVSGLQKEFWNRKFSPAWRKVGKVLLAAFWILNSVYLVAATFRPADPSFGVYKHINTHYKNEEITVVGMGKDPYGRMADLYMKFYMYPNYKTFKARNAAELKEIITTSDVPVLFFSEAPAFEAPAVLDSVNLPYKAEYYTMPLWFKHINFNKWVERSPNWALYNVRPDLMEGNPRLGRW